MGEVQFKPWSHESASHRKLTCDNLRWHQSNGVTCRHKFFTFAKYSLTFLRWYISYDSPLKRCRKEMFLLPLLTCVFPSLTISSFFFQLALLLALADLALLLSLWVLVWFKTTSTSSNALNSTHLNAKCWLWLARKAQLILFTILALKCRVHKEKDLGVILSNNMSLGTPIFNGL